MAGQRNLVKPQSRPVRTMFGTALLALLAIVSTTSCYTGSLPETSALGPEVDRIPERAYAAVMVAPPAFEFAYRTVQDNSWVVFVDRDMSPLGYMHQKGMFRSQIVRFRDGIAFADHENYFVTSKTGTQVEAHDAGGMSLQASTPDALDSEDAFLWLDDGVVNGKYRSTAIGISPDGHHVAKKIDGRIASFDRCNKTPYAVIPRDFSEIGSVQTYELAEIDTSEKQPDTTKSKWIFAPSSFGGGLPYSCGKDGQVGVFLSDGDRVSEDQPVGSGFWNVNVENGTSDWHPLPVELAKESAVHGGIYSQYLAPFGANTAWRNSEGAHYVDQDGRVSVIRDGETAAKYLFTLAPDIRDRDLDAVAVGSGTQGLAYFSRTDADGKIGSADGEFVIVDLSSGQEQRRIHTPQWLADLVASDPFSVSDIALLEGIG